MCRGSTLYIYLGKSLEMDKCTWKRQENVSGRELSRSTYLVTGNEIEPETLFRCRLGTTFSRPWNLAWAKDTIYLARWLLSAYLFPVLIMIQASLQNGFLVPCCTRVQAFHPGHRSFQNRRLIPIGIPRTFCDHFCTVLSCPALR